ncbi:MAG: HD domain-containing protein [Candidatus Caldarchaeum sp.]
MKLIKDPVHGYITLSDQELGLVDTRVVQRLRRISQLPLVYLVYPGARHSRFDHSIGCMFLAGEFAQHLGLDSYETTLLKTAALLHDIGHTPFSHLFEQLLLDKGVSHEQMSMRIIEHDKELGEALEMLGIDRGEVVKVLQGRSRLSSLVSGPLDVDRLDFLVRDAYFTGATYGIIDVKRIIRLTRLLEDGPAVDVRGVGAVEELAIARYHSFINIYFHHAVRAAQILLLRGATMLKSELNFSEMTPQQYVEHDDFSTWCFMKNHPATRWVVERLERRILPRRLYEKQVFGEVRKITTLAEQREVEEEVAEMAGINPSKVYFDFSHAPPLTKYGPGEVRLYPSDSAESWILRELSKPLHVFRIYVDRDVEEVERVRNAAEKVISSILE